MADCPQEFTLVCWMTGDSLSIAERNQVEQHMQECEACQARVESIKNEIEQKQPEIENDWQLIRAELGKKEPQPIFRIRWQWALPVAAAAAVALALFVMPEGVLETEHPTMITTKGQLAVEVKGRGETGVVELTSGAVVRPGMPLRFVLHAPSPGYVTIFSIDSHFQISSLYPEETEAASSLWKIDQLGTHQMPGSVVFDDVPGIETVYVYFSKAKFDNSRIQSLALNFQRNQPEKNPNAAEWGLDGQLVVFRFSKGAQ